MRIILAASLLVAFAVLAADAPPAPPAAGAAAPTFALPSQEGSSVNLDQYRGKWVVLYFYPRDFTSGCTVEAHNFQRDLAEFEKRNAVILGVSVDSVDSHKGFCTKEDLHFKLLADEKHDVSTKYGSIMTRTTDKGEVTFSARNTFLIDPKGVIQQVYIKVDPSKHSEQVLADLDKLQAAK
jgi:peroxiredoxin Q/BCP